MGSFGGSPGREVHYVARMLHAVGGRSGAHPQHFQVLWHLHVERCGLERLLHKELHLLRACFFGGCRIVCSFLLKYFLAQIAMLRLLLQFQASRRSSPAISSVLLLSEVTFDNKMLGRLCLTVGPGSRAFLCGFIFVVACWTDLHPRI